MPSPLSEPDDLPEYMTWEELAALPEEIAGQIELWEGRVVWVRRGPAEHQDCTNLFWNALRRCVREEHDRQPDRCWRVSTETNVFLGRNGKSDFLTPDFLVYRCLPAEYQDVRADDVLLVGEVLSPSNTVSDMEAKKARYAEAGIDWYWEVKLARNPRGIATVRAYALQTRTGNLPPGVHALHAMNYILADEWTPRADPNGISIEFPFPITIPWTELEL
ncbi:Uma2 family endonuclease [Nocardia kruczakiae]|uniref:Uma2 family endonuclease n=1 Tax=Nocardia kruczakiae TaxID=261477 RepID=A0ABU1XMQ0_9NOCA|nr:Uma2 family endonuclease [Nocardia kruczakiae]MDR7171831.1 Uma2 family endonuclease [Nocardia kruczakiae]